MTLCAIYAGRTPETCTRQELCVCREDFEERAAIREYDGMMPRSVAEKKAREDVSRYQASENKGSEI